MMESKEKTQIGQAKKWQTSMTMILAALPVPFLYNSNQRSKDPLSIDLSVIDSVKHTPNNPLYLPDLPDNMDGAYIFGNGFEDAFELLGIEKRFRSVEIPTRIHIKGREEKVDIRTDPDRIDIHLETSQPMNMIESRLSSSCQLIWHDAIHYSIGFFNLGEDDQIAIHENGEISFLSSHLPSPGNGENSLASPKRNQPSSPIENLISSSERG